MPSYIYRNKDLIKIEPDTLPIGIIQHIQPYQNKVPLYEDDIIIMYSDGFDMDIENVLKLVLAQINHQIPQYIADEIMSRMLNCGKIDDDATIVVLKIKKVSC